MIHLLTCALLAALQLPSGRDARGFPGHVLVVGGGGAYSDIQPAVDAARDGDAVLVRTGTYSGFTIPDKSLVVVADAGATVDVQGSVRVDGLAAGHSVLVAGIVVHGPSSQPPASGAFTASHDAGVLRLEDCTILGANGVSTTPARAAVVLDADADVGFVACTLQGGAGDRDAADPRDGASGESALSARSSSVAVYDCVFRGGSGGDGGLGGGQVDAGDGGSGGVACRVEDGFVFLGGSELDGGTGGRGGDSGPCLSNSYPGGGGAGGACILVASAATPPNTVLLGNHATAGAGGLGGQDTSGADCYGDGARGADGAVVVAPAGAVESFAGASRRLECPRVARGNTYVPMSCTGRPGDMVTILVSASPAFAYDAQQHGVRLVDAAHTQVLASGTIPASGVLALRVGLPTAGPDARSIQIQAFVRDTANARFIGSAVTLVALDPAY
ncbi:MAG TPA: hypothetical protein VGR31_00190 [Planctomycetota bacterium]|jgi:hypothetical protein|nr:hypothetical protein [Planctomycetota bacterium]